MHQVLHTFFSPHNFRVALPEVWAGFQVNLKLMVVAEVLVLVLALAVAIVRGLPGRGAKPLRALMIVYTDFFRGTPLILVAFVVGFGLPGAQHPLIATARTSLRRDRAHARLHGVRDRGLPRRHRVGAPSQRMAARSLGLSYWQSMRYVVIPQAVRRVIPPLLNDFIGLQKDTALVSVIGVAEAALQAQRTRRPTRTSPRTRSPRCFFVLLTIPLARFTDHLIAARERRERAAAT